MPGNPQLALKLYHRPDAEREAKIRDIVQAQLGGSCPQVAFPLDLVSFGDGRFAGFIMPRATGHHPIHELIAPRSRRQMFPDADWRFLVRVAHNVTRIVAGVHGAGVVIGDINSAGFLVSRDALVTLIDADSFQVGTHRCRVGMPEYTPPEIQGTRFEVIDRTADHDGFGLAVLLFQILALGRHPYAGVLPGRPLAIDAAIAKGRFAYSLIREVGTSPPPGTLRLTDLPAGIRLLFERAFAPRGGARPTAQEWTWELALLEGSLASCPNRLHHAISSLALPCPWCRIEQLAGHTIFPAPAALPAKARPVQTVLDQDVARALRRAKPFIGEKVVPLWRMPNIAPSPAATHVQPVPGNRQQAFAQSLWSITGIPSKYRPFVERFAGAHIAAIRALTSWRTQIGVWKARTAADLLRQDLLDLHPVMASLPIRLAQAEARCLAQATRQIMATYTIADARLPGIGTALIGQLATRCICSAADIDRAALKAILGLGETRIVTLLFWRDALAVHVERTARHDGLAIAAALAREKARLDRNLTDAEASIRRRIDYLAARTDAVRTLAAVVDPAVEAAIRERDQAAADLAWLGIDTNDAVAAVASSTASTSHSRVATKANSKSGNSKSSKTKVGKACPKCGAPMIKRWSASAGSGGKLLGCTKYPQCNGSRMTGRKSSRP
ncbi:hypothetical protein [Sphingomonas sp. LR55]|uniref:hypothetical protein n=1 Tax=Sphingomonas sp. LR55 TaxID=3050231 RepID=UPI002FE34F23